MDTTINIHLPPKTMESVEIRARQTPEIQKSTEMGKLSIPVDQIKSMPALLGKKRWVPV